MDYDLIPIFENNKFQIKDYDEMQLACEKFIEDLTGGISLDILDRPTYKAVTDARTEIRKKQNQVARVRIDANELAMGVFNTQAKTLESMLRDIDNKLKAYVNTFDKEINNKQEKPTKIALTIKSYDEKTIEKVKAYALKLACEVSIK